jgi:hypothetical protein
VVYHGSAIRVSIMIPHFRTDRVPGTGQRALRLIPLRKFRRLLLRLTSYGLAPETSGKPVVKKKVIIRRGARKSYGLRRE